MKGFFTRVKYDYLQRTRSYAFLITLCTSLAIAYTFVPEPNAKYSTISIANYIGYYNAAWFGYVTALMTSMFLALIGFYLVNSGINTDKATKIGQIIATTPTTNLIYLLYKMLSNFLVLLTILAFVLVMSITLFFIYNDGYIFEPLQYLKPYLFITVPSLFFIATLAVLFEVLFGKYSVLKNVGFFFLFSFLLLLSPEDNPQYELDVFGTQLVMDNMTHQVQDVLKTNEELGMNIGYVIGSNKPTRRFEFKGITFPNIFLVSRMLWMFLGLGLVILSANWFHRFDSRERTGLKKKSTVLQTTRPSNEIAVVDLPKAEIDYNIVPILKAELLLLFRKGKRWLWLINLIGMLLLATLPLTTAHQIVLPILWFLQVSRLSDIIIKDRLYQVHYFTFTSYKPLFRLVFTQLLSVMILLLLLALPLMARYIVLLEFYEVLEIVLGASFIVALAAFLGSLSKGKKLFEVLFFMITYANINGIVFLDYFGGFTHSTSYQIKLGVLIIVLSTVSFSWKHKRLYS